MIQSLVSSSLCLTLLRLKITKYLNEVTAKSDVNFVVKNLHFISNTCVHI